MESSDLMNQILLYQVENSNLKSKLVEKENEIARLKKSNAPTEEKEWIFEPIDFMNEEDVNGMQECRVDVKFEKGETFHLKEVGQESCPSPAQHQDYHRTDTDDPTVKNEIINVSSDDEDDNSLKYVEDAQLEQQVNELNKESVVEAQDEKTEEEENFDTNEMSERSNQDDNALMFEESDNSNDVRSLAGYHLRPSRSGNKRRHNAESETNDGHSQTRYSLRLSRSGFQGKPRGCGKTFQPQANLAIHQNTHTTIASCSGTGVRFCCQHPGCESSFKHKGSLKQHQNAYTNKFQCQVCQNGFASTQELKRHKSVHSVERPFACDWPGCGGTYKWKDQLARHRRVVHLKEKPFHCNEDDCGKSFATKYYLQIHLKYRHSSLRPFQCQEEKCGKRFKLKSEVTKQVKYVHFKVRNFPCNFENCKRACVNRFDLKRHLKIHRKKSRQLF